MVFSFTIQSDQKKKLCELARLIRHDHRKWPKYMFFILSATETLICGTWAWGTINVNPILVGFMRKKMKFSPHVMEMWRHHLCYCQWIDGNRVAVVCTLVCKHWAHKIQWKEHKINASMWKIKVMRIICWNALSIRRNDMCVIKYNAGFLKCFSFLSVCFCVFLLSFTEFYVAVWHKRRKVFWMVNSIVINCEANSELN